MTFANEGDKPSHVTAAHDTNDTWGPGERPDIGEAKIGEADITTVRHYGGLGNGAKPKSSKHQGRPPKKPRDHTEINPKSWSLRDFLGRRSSEEQELPELSGIIPGDEDDGDGSSTTTVSTASSKDKKPKPWKVRGSPRNQSDESKLSNENSRSTEYRSWSLKGLLASTKNAGEQGEGIEPAVGVGVGGGSSASSTPTGRKLRNGNVAGSNTSSPLRIGSPIFLPGKSFLTPSATFARLREEKDEMSRMTPSPTEWSLREGVTLPLIGKVQWATLKRETIKWLLNPKNFALLVWMIAVVVAGAILFMVMVGMLDAAIPKKSDRDTYYEVSNQILNALFVLMALYTHPLRTLHLFWLIRWNSDDILKLRKLYCKGGLRKPHEWSHMLVVVLLLQLNCFATYALAGLNWGYRRANRPAIGVGITLAVAFGAGAAAGIYNSLSPLGKDFELEREDDDIDVGLDREEKGLHVEGGHSGPNLFKLHKRNYDLLEKRMSFSCRAGRPVANPQWEGGLFACHEEPTISILSTACFCCVMGWNLERLGFGNRFVHVVTFLLLLGAPYLVFDLAATNVNNRYNTLAFFCLTYKTATCICTFDFVTCLANLAQMRLPILKRVRPQSVDER